MNLWTEALQHSSLKEKDRECIANIIPTRLDDILHVVEAQQVSYRANRVTIKGRKGERIVLSDIFAKITEWVKTFVAVGDVAVQYDPGHAALPWAAVRFILQSAVNLTVVNVVIIEGIQQITRILAWGRLQEALCLAQTHGFVGEIRQEFITLYARILSFLAKVYRFYAQKKLSEAHPSCVFEVERLMICCVSLDRVVGSILILSEKYATKVDEIVKQQATVERFSTQLRARAQISNAQISESKQSELLKILEELRKPFGHIGNVSQHTYDIIRNTADNSLLDWISNVPYGKHHAQIQKSVMPNTGMWLQQHSRVREWKDSSATQIFWLHGIPGSGKSHLM